MGSDAVVIHPPCLKNLPGMAQRGEQGLIEAFVPQPAIKAFNESVLLGLSRRDILPFHTAGLAPLQNGRGGQLRAVVGYAAERPATPGNDGVQFPRDAAARQRGVGQSWLGKFKQRDKWSFCLTVATMAARQERP